MMKIDRFRPFRRLARVLQAIIILGLPFLRLDGESALRFDIPSLRLYFFGTGILMNEFFLVLAAVIFITFLIVLVTVLYGRVWCGWACPQTVLVDFSGFAQQKGTKGVPRKLGDILGVAGISALVSASLIWYFVSPYDFLARLTEGTLGSVIVGFWIVMAIVIFLDLLLLRHRFCATVCPYAKLQGVLFDRNTMVIAFDPSRKDECMDCSACVRICPVGIDIREGLNGACINCAECIDVCRDRTEPRGKAGLIGYHFGEPGLEKKWVRPGVVLAGIGTLAFLVLFVLLAVSRSAFDVTVLPDLSNQMRQIRPDDYRNSYILAVENRTTGPIELSVRVTISNGEASVYPDVILLESEEYRKIRIEVTLEAYAGGKRKLPLNIVVSGRGKHVTRTANFFLPVGTE